jgi:hypothetical protein
MSERQLGIPEETKMSTITNDPKTKEYNRWKALVEFYRTGDILQLQRRLRHKHVRTTWAYLDRYSPLIKLLGEPANAQEI